MSGFNLTSASALACCCGCNCWYARYATSMWPWLFHADAGLVSMKTTDSATSQPSACLNINCRGPSHLSGDGTDGPEIRRERRVQQVLVRHEKIALRTPAGAPRVPDDEDAAFP